MISAPIEPNRDCQRRRQGHWKLRVQHRFGAERRCNHFAAEAVDDDRNAGIGGAHQREPEFDCAKARLGEMLMRPRRQTEPRVVGDVQHPSRTLGA